MVDGKSEELAGYRSRVPVTEPVIDQHVPGQCGYTVTVVVTIDGRRDGPYLSLVISRRRRTQHETFASAKKLSQGVTYPHVRPSKLSNSVINLPSVASRSGFS